MLHKFLTSEGAKKLSKKEQKNINGGLSPIRGCFGTGTGGVSSVGYSSACVGQENGTRCTINGYQAACTGIGGGFWFY